MSGPVYDCGAENCDECQRAFGPDRSKAIAEYESRDRYYASLPKVQPSTSTTN